MTDKPFPGPMSMIKIDGQKIKDLREQQGLTQLYLATAVDVTTDTISRWENKRYPSIKTENGIRLAEALGVEIDEILDHLEDASKTEIESKSTPHPTDPPDHTENSQQKKSLKNVWPILLLSGTLFGVILAFMFSYFQSTNELTIAATRSTPEHFIAGQPFPVIIELSGQSEKEVAFILKESIPEQAKVIQSTPQHSAKSSETPILKWITKSNVPVSFSYIMLMAPSGESTITFDGSIATSGGDPLPIAGSTTISAGNHHWADSDTDNIISDKEILTVYDKYAELPGLVEEIDLIEEIWLGEGYSWNAETLQYDITE